MTPCMPFLRVNNHTQTTKLKFICISRHELYNLSSAEENTILSCFTFDDIDVSWTSWSEFLSSNSRKKNVRPDHFARDWKRHPTVKAVLRLDVIIFASMAHFTPTTFPIHFQLCSPGLNYGQDASNPYFQKGELISFSQQGRDNRKLPGGNLRERQKHIFESTDCLLRYEDWAWVTFCRKSLFRVRVAAVQICVSAIK